MQNKRGGRISITFKEDYFFISSLAVKTFKLERHSYVHFVHDEEKLYCFFNDDSNGIKLDLHSNGFAGLRFRGRTFYNILKQKFPIFIYPSAKYILKLCATKINESVTLEVLLNKPVCN